MSSILLDEEVTITSPTINPAPVSPHIGFEVSPAGPETPVDDRLGYIGASDIAAAAGISPWKTPLQLYYEKRGELPPEDLSDNDRVYWGTVMEEPVARRYEREMGYRVQRVNRLLQDRVYPFIATHVDRIVRKTDILLECKTAGHKKGWGDPGTDQIPEYYMAQVQYMLGITGRASCDVAVLFFGNEFQIYHIPRDEKYIGALKTIAIRFWKRIKQGFPPEPKTREDNALFWPTSREGVVEAEPEILPKVRELSHLYQEVEAIGTRISALESDLQRAIADNGLELTYQGQRLATWKPVSSLRLNRKQLEKEHPELVKDYLVESTSRRFEAKRYLKGITL